MKEPDHQFRSGGYQGQDSHEGEQDHHDNPPEGELTMKSRNQGVAKTTSRETRICLLGIGAIVAVLPARKRLGFMRHMQALINDHDVLAFAPVDNEEDVRDLYERILPTWLDHG